MEVSNLQSWAGLDTVKLWEGTCPIGWLEGFRRTESTIGGLGGETKTPWDWSEVVKMSGNGPVKNRMLIHTHS